MSNNDSLNKKKLLKNLNGTTNIGWFVNDVSTTIFKFGKGVISTFKSMPHNVNLALVEVIVEALTLIKGVGRKLIFS